MPKADDVQMFLIYAAGPLLFGLIATDDWGKDVDPAFYAVVASIIPLLLLAFLLEFGVAYDFNRDPHHAQHASRMRFFLRGVFTGAGIAETVSLYAVAANTSSSFLCVVCVVECALLFISLALTYELRFHRP